MLRHKAPDFRPLTAVSLEDLIPEDNFYWQGERSIDLNFVHDLANAFYSNIGRPSIDPVVFFKLQLIAFLMDFHFMQREIKMITFLYWDLTTSLSPTLFCERLSRIGIR